MIRKRRKLGSIIHDPINNFMHDDINDTLIFIEQDKKAASQTRAAALMYIMRHDYPLCTHVSENKVYILKDKDVMEEMITIDIR